MHENKVALTFLSGRNMRLKILPKYILSVRVIIIIARRKPISSRTIYQTSAKTIRLFANVSIEFFFEYWKPSVFVDYQFLTSMKRR